VFTRGALLAPGLGLALTILPIRADAAPERQVLLVVVPNLSYEDLLGRPGSAELASAGGLGLLTTSGRADLPARTAVNLGAGRPADDAPAGPVPFRPADGGLSVDIEAYRAAAGDGIPGLLGSALADAGALVGYLDPRSSAGSPAMLVAMDSGGLIPAAVLDASGAGPTFPDGATDIVGEAQVLVSTEPETIPLFLMHTEAEEVLVIVVGAGVSPAMHERGDTVAPILVARGSPDDLLAGGDGPTGLTSSTTRRQGVVSDVDVAPTILDFLGLPAPEEMVGSPIRPSGEPPTGLHDRYLGFRRVVGPVGAVLLALGLASLAAGLAVVFLTKRPAPRSARVTGLVMLASLALFVATVPASLLPSFRYGAVALALAAVGAAVLAVAVRSGGRDPMAAVAVIAVVGLVLVLVDGLLGWPSQLTPMLGGGVLDGERFFGLGNAHTGIVLAGAVLGAARLPTGAGVALMGAGAVFAGLPFLGADLGGSLTLAIAAALWFGLRRWRTLGWRTWVLAAAIAVGTLVIVTVADRLLPGGGTHLSRAASGRGALAAFGERLAGNARTTSANASAWLAVLGLPVWLVVAWLRPARLRPTLDPDPRWRDAVMVLAIAGIAGYVLNDTYGLAGSTFAFVSAAMLYPTLSAIRTAQPSDAPVRPGGLEPPTGGSCAP
jgi:hypothetical protein